MTGGTKYAVCRTRPGADDERSCSHDASMHNESIEMLLAQHKDVCIRRVAPHLGSELVLYAVSESTRMYGTGRAHIADSS